MITILDIEGYENDPCSFYRGRGVLTELRKNYGYEIIPYFSGMEWSWLKMMDIVFLQRPCMDWQYNVIIKAKALGKKIWVDFDDDVLNIPDTHPIELVEFFKNTVKTTIQIAKLADIITVSTISLKEKFAKLNDNIVVIPNALDDSCFPLQCKQKYSDNKKILWRGSRTHENDVYCYKDALLNGMQHDWEFNFICDQQFMFIQKFANSNYKYTRSMELIEYFQFIKNLNPSLCIVPLDENELNLSKSNINWIEATYVGAACLIPDFGDFKFCNGLHYLNQMQFEGKLLSAIEGKHDLKEINRQSWEYIKENLLLTYLNLQRKTIVENLMDKK
jgi:hypothetical protein